MPIDRTNAKGNYPKARPWHATQKRSGIHYHLGYFASEKEALTAEAEFSRHYPPKNNIGRNPKLLALMKESGW